MTEVIIQGRPDLENFNYGTTVATRHYDYVFSNDSNGCLIHYVRRVELRWYEVDTRETLRRLNKPKIYIVTKCGQVFFEKRRCAKSRTRRPGFTMCMLPSTDAVMCGRCQGEGASFRKGADSSSARKEAHRKLGCVVEVAG